MSQSAKTFHLLPGEEMLEIQEFNDSLPETPPSAIRDLEMLAGVHRGKDIGKRGPVVASIPLESHVGIPEYDKYEAEFVRDGERAAKNLLFRYPNLARNTLLRFAELQGVSNAPSREEELGRIPHEIRYPEVDPVARQLTEERGWGWPYYGAVDSTLEFTRTLIAYCRSQPSNMGFLQQTFIGRDKNVHRMVDALDSAVNWTTRRLDSNKEGLLEFRKAIPRGIENQVWRDAWDSYHHADGITMANHDSGVASTEVQRVAYDTLLDAAELYQELGNSQLGEELSKRANTIRHQLLGKFWNDSRGGFFVLGLDRDKNGNHRQLTIKTSDMGHLLHSRFLADDIPSSTEMVESIIIQLFSRELLSCSGIRTLASSEKRFRAGAYQNGSVWLWENYLIAQGLDYHGYHGLASFLKRCILDVIHTTRRMPEYVRGGFDNTHRVNTRKITVWDSANKRKNVAEEPPQDIHATTAAAVLAIKLEHNKMPTEAKDGRKRSLETKVLATIPFAH
ncbi:MAG TPA: hypothetical protein VMR18_00020 [Candidatus Saccharimonadales bacterium]|nr:hypothetical protein [Candidatus Saccharimonadales bacterium]